jgi:enamine deaminase RidA (YjgF/YER057c/UK114 family)
MHDRNRLRRLRTTPAFAGYYDIYSDGVEAPSGLRWLHTAGQVALRADGSVPATFADQCEQALMNLIAVLDAAHMSPPDIVKLTCYVVGAQDIEVLYTARRTWLGGSAPAATVIVVQGLAAPQLMVEIEAVAATDDAPTPTKPAG